MASVLCVRRGHNLTTTNEHSKRRGRATEVTRDPLTLCLRSSRSDPRIVVQRCLIGLHPVNTAVLAQFYAGAFSVVVFIRATFMSGRFTTVQNGSYALLKAHMRSTSSVIRLSILYLNHFQSMCFIDDTPPAPPPPPTPPPSDRLRPSYRTCVRDISDL